MDFSKEDFLKNLSSAVRDFYTVNGKIYGIPWGTYNAMGVLYNKDVFAKVGVQPPSNYVDFLAICEKIKKAGITPVYDAGKTGWPVQIFSMAGFQTFVLPAIGGADGVAKLGSNQLRIKDIPAVKDVFTLRTSLRRSSSGTCSPPSTSPRWGSSTAPFGPSGWAAWLQTGSTTRASPCSPSS